MAWDVVAGMFKWPLLIQYLATGVTVALILISELIQFNLPVIPILLVHTIGTCLCGLFAEEMLQLSEEFRNATFYGVTWDGDVESAKFLMFMNINMHNSFKLAIAGNGIYTNEKVLLIFKMAYTIVMYYVNITGEGNPKY